MAVAFLLKDLTGQLPDGSSVCLPQSGKLTVGAAVRGSVVQLREELAQFYPGRFEIELVTRE